MIIKFKTTKKYSRVYDYTEHTWDLTNQLDVDKFLGMSKYPFVKGGWIEKSGLTPQYEICVKDEWVERDKILYLLTIGGKILKGGKSKNPLPDRTYGAGTEENWTMKGSPSDTNYIYSQIFRECLKQNIEIDFYVFQAPKVEIEFPCSTGGVKTTMISPYEEMESDLNKHLMDVLGKKPIGEGKLFEQHKS